MAIRILLVEDDPAIVVLLTYNLKAAGYETVSATSAEDALLCLAEQRFDLIVLDWMLPEMSGIEFCRQVRRSAEYSAIPILMLTARGEEADRVRGLTTGADDYVVKPFSVLEVTARVASLLRRATPERVADHLICGSIILDRQAHQVTRNSRPVVIGPTEYRLLEVLMESAGRVLTRGQLIDRVWHNTAEIDDRTIDVHIGRLRKALIRGQESDPIRTVRGTGYAIQSDR